MDILTIVKANIKAHKGQFIGLVLLVVFCVTSIVAFYNVMQSTDKSVAEEYDYIGVADEYIYVERSLVTDEVIKSLDNLDCIDHYTLTPVLGIHRIMPEGWDPNDRSRVYSSTVQIMPKPDADSCVRYPQVNESITEKLGEDYVINPGEVYLSNGIASQIDVHVGDKVEFTSENIHKTFTIGGIIEDEYASITVGYKNVLINEADYEDFCNEVFADNLGNGYDEEFNVCVIGLYKTDKSMSSRSFRDAVNNATGLYDYSSNTMKRDEFLGYNCIIPDIFSTVLIIVALVLYLVLDIVIGNTITSAVRDNYKELGILKANGFSARKLRLVYIIQYLVTEIVGIIIGLILGYGLCRFILNTFARLAGYVLTPHIDILVTSSIILGILLLSLIIIVICTAKVSSVSPYKAISETGSDVYFANKMVTPVTKKGLSLSLALRQITSSKLSYLGLIISSMILMVLLVFAQASGSAMSSKKTALSMSDVGEIYLGHYYYLSEEDQQAVLDDIAAKATIQDHYSQINYYVSGEYGDILTTIYETGEEVHCVSEGRAPIYDNEVVIGKAVASEYEKNIGDTITLTYNGKSYDYLITGIVSTTQDLGKVAAMGKDAAAHIGFDERFDLAYKVIVLENPKNPNEWYPHADAENLCKELNDKYEKLSAVAPDTAVFGSDIQEIIDIIKYVVYAIAIAVVFIIINMSCSKFFHNEVKQLGIYKASGFTSTSIRAQFAMRFAIIFTLGAFLGGILSGIILTPVFGILFSTFGSTQMTIDFYPSLYLIPLVFVMVISYIAAYVASRRIKKVDVNVLITE